MAAPSYTNDLTDWIIDSDTTAWGELVNAISGGAPDEADTESALQGTNTVSQATNTTSLCSMCRILGSPVTLTSGQVFLVWHGHGVATALLGYASGGLRLAVAGSTLTDWKAWAVGGNDVPPHPYGKWVNNPVDPTVSSDYTNGTPPSGGTSIYGVGSMCILSLAVAKGQPHVVDMIRYGRAEARFNGGDLANGYATFSGFATANDASTARWGLIQAVDGGYLWKGLMTLGYSSAVDFRDSNKTIFIQDTRKVSSTFNKIDVRQSTSRVDWTGITFTCLAPSTTASKGAFEMIDAADVNIDTCTFTDMGTFIFKSTATINDSTFRRCGAITSGGATFSNCTITNSTAAASVTASSYTDIEDFSDCTFVSDTSNHAIDLGTVSATASVSWANILSGYAGTNGSTGNEALKVNVASGQTLTINVVDGYSSPSVYNTGSGTVTIVTGTRTVTVATVDVNGDAVGSANVFLKAVSGGGGLLPAGAAVTLTRSGTTATAEHATAHNLLTGDKVFIEGASQQPYNGVFTITVTSTTQYTYTMGSDPGASGSGTATFVFLKDTTHPTTGLLSMSRSITADQPVTGWGRKYSESTFYKTGLISGTVSSTQNTDFTSLLLSDQ